MKTIERIFLMAAAVTTLFAGSSLVSQSAQASSYYATYSCHQLWVARNEIYKNNGKCFKTPKAVEYFGNGGCRSYNVTLGGFDASNVAAIQRIERNKGCGRPSPQPSTSCHELWVQRNQIFKNHGYCFKSPKAIRYFGNRGCYTDSVNLPPGPQREVDQIRGYERDYGCN